jgi:hypothetical protein
VFWQAFVPHSRVLFKTFPVAFQERVINELDFSKITTRFLEASLLQDLVTKSTFQNLQFNNSEVLTDEIFKKILQKGQHIQNLAIVNCVSLTPKILGILHECSNLEKLSLMNLDWSAVELSNAPLRATF